MAPRLVRRMAQLIRPVKGRQSGARSEAGVERTVEASGRAQEAVEQEHQTAEERVEIARPALSEASAQFIFQTGDSADFGTSLIKGVGVGDAPVMQHMSIFLMGTRLRSIRPISLSPAAFPLFVAAISRTRACCAVFCNAIPTNVKIRQKSPPLSELPFATAAHNSCTALALSRLPLSPFRAASAAANSDLPASKVLLEC